MPYPSYSDIIAAIYQAALGPEHWAGTLDLVADYLGVDSGMVLHLSASRDSNFIIHQRLREDLNQLFLQHYTENPYRFAFARSPIGKTLVTEELLGKEVLHRSAFYADILAPQGITEIIAVRHSGLSQDGVGGILFNVSKRRANHILHAVTRLDRLISHLFRAVDLTLRISRLNAGQQQLARVLHLMPSPALLIDAALRITYANSPAEALLRQNDGLTATRDSGLQLAAALPSESAALSGALAEALSVAAGGEDVLRGPLRLTRPSGRAPLLVLLAPLPPPAFVVWKLVEAARAMILVIDPEAQPLAAAEAVRTAFGLTAAEARVAALIGGGLSGPQTAAALGISPETVKTHLARCFAKMGIHSQAGLVRLLAALPVDLPSLSGDNQKPQPAD